MIGAPFQGFPPELLAQMAKVAFRPPGVMGGGMQAPGMQMPQTPGFGMGDGISNGMGMGLGMGLSGWKPGSGSVPGDTAANAPSSVGGQPIGTYQGPDSYSYGVPPGPPNPNPSTGSNFWSWLPWNR